MKKTALLLIFALLLFSSCAPSYSIEINQDGTLTMESQLYCPIENSYRFTDYGTVKKIGAVAGGDVYFIAEGVLLVERDNADIYYVSEERRGFDKTFEECEAFFFVPEGELDADGRINEKYADNANRLTGEEAENFAFYVFYGRTPDELGYKGGEYAGEIFAEFSELEGLVSSYPVYRYSPNAYSVEIDNVEYMLEIELARMIKII